METTQAKAGVMPRHIDFENNRFEIDGKTYHIEGDLVAERYAAFQVFQLELGYNTSFMGVMQKVREAYDYVNRQEFANSAVKLYDIMNGIVKIEEMEHPILKLCALFCNTDDEDRTKYSDAMVSQKAAIFLKSGISMNDFFRCAADSIDGYMSVYRDRLQIIMRNARSAQKAEK